MPRSRELAELATSYDSGGSLGFRNRIINGAMVIDQRNNGASVTLSGSTQLPVDRFSAIKQTSAATVTAQRSTVAPAGFTNSLLFTVSTGAAPAAGDINAVWHVIEGFNVADFGWGTANAQSVAVSFWARSSITGTYAVSFNNSAANRFYAATYTISSANTWEYKTVIIAGDTSGTWLTDNGAGVQVTWDLGYGSNFNGTAGVWGSSVVRRTSGSVQLFANTGATFYITGVQLEKGSTATSFDVRPYGTELVLCQRYTQVIRSNASGTTGLVNLACISSTRAYGEMPFEMQMRSSPIITFSAANTFQTRNSSGNSLTVTAITAASINIYSYDLDVSVASGLTAGDCTSTSMIAGTSGLITISAEL
jgi:hypothetical protein